MNNENTDLDGCERFKKKYLHRTNFLRGEFKYIIDKLLKISFYWVLLNVLPGSKIIRTFRIHGMLQYPYTNKDMLQIYLIAQVFLTLVSLCLILRQ